MSQIHSEPFIWGVKQVGLQKPGIPLLMALWIYSGSTLDLLHWSTWSSNFVECRVVRQWSSATPGQRRQLSVVEDARNEVAEVAKLLGSKSPDFCPAMENPPLQSRRYHKTPQDAFANHAVTTQEKRRTATSQEWFNGVSSKQTLVNSIGHETTRSEARTPFPRVALRVSEGFAVKQLKGWNSVMSGNVRGATTALGSGL